MRRRAILAAIGLLGMATAGGARAASGLDGTWGGAAGEVTAQVIVTGGEVIGFYWRGDYMDAADAKFSPDGTSLAFAFKGGRATLTRTGDATATIAITEGAKVTRLDLRRD